MGAIAGTKVKLTEFAGQMKILVVSATIASASDTLTLTLASHGIETIDAIVGVQITKGMDADFQTVMAAYDGLVITLTSKQADGGAADEFTTTEVNVTVIGH